MAVLENVKAGDSQYEIVEAEAEVRSVRVNGTCYIIPAAVARLLADLAEQVGKEQRRRRLDDEEISRFIESQAFHIAYVLSGGDEDGAAYYGENLLGHSLGEKIPLPEGTELDNGSTHEDFYSVVARRIVFALRTSSRVKGELAEMFDGSRPVSV